MTREEMRNYANRYRKIQQRLSIGLSIFIFIIAIILIAAAVLIAINSDNSVLLWAAAIIMLILSAADTFMGFRFIKYAKHKFRSMSDKEAAEHYCKIHGFDSKIKK